MVLQCWLEEMEHLYNARVSVGGGAEIPQVPYTDLSSWVVRSFRVFTSQGVLHELIVLVVTLEGIIIKQVVYFPTPV